MKGIDVVVALLSVSESDPPRDYAELAAALGIGAATAHRSARRLEKAGLMEREGRRVPVARLEEFLFHGLRYVFPAELGAPSLGVPTAHSAPVLAARIASSESDRIVWPSPLGDARGASLAPLHVGVPAAALARPPLYDLLALVDVLRVGRAREVRIAREEISERLRRVAAA